MKKTILLSALVLILISCKKEMPGSTELSPQLNERSAGPENFSAKRSTQQKFSVTEPYNSFIFDTCRQETVFLTGTVTYYIEEVVGQNKAYVNYDIDLTNVTGVGEFTGTIYTGGGTFRSSSRYTLNDGDVRGKFKLSIKYVAANGQEIVISEYAHGVFVNGRTRVEFHSVSETCK